MKKFLSFLLSVMLVCSMAILPAGAVDIKISGTATGYDAYRIFDLSQAVKPGHDETGDCTAEGCDKVENPSGHWNYGYSFNEKYRPAVIAGLAAVDINGELDDRGMLSEIEKLDNELIRMFADAVYGIVKDMEAEYSVSGSELKDIEPGYYLIAEKADTAVGDSVSLVMLDTAGLEEVRVTTKEDVPTLEKKIAWGDGIDGEYGIDSEIVSAGDEVTYYLVAEMPSSDVLSNYPSYRLVFHDDVSEGLSIIPDSVRYCVYRDGDIDGEFGMRFYGDESSWIPEHVLIRERGDAMSDDTCDLEVVFDDVKPFFDVSTFATGFRYHGNGMLVVKYRCKILETAKVGEYGNPNSAKLEFSNNPYHEGPTTETPEDKCTVFTFGLHVDKTDGNNPLSGAEFSLYKWDWGNDDWSLESTVINPVEGSDGTQFEITGLGEGKYKLVETKTPDGYQKCDDIEFQIIAESEELSDDPKLTKLEVVDMDGNSMTGEDGIFMIDMNTGMITTEIANYGGLKLPSTGGSGVHWIYMAGGLMVAVAVIGLWRKRRESVM